MPWRPLPRIAFAICSHPFHPTSSADLPLQLGDELYIIEQGGKDGEWFRGYLVAPPSLLSGLTSTRGQPLEARVFSGIFPKVCVEIRELLGDVIHHGQDQAALLRSSAAKSATSKMPTSPNTAVGRSDTSSRIRKPPAPVPMLKIGDESATSEDEPLVDEIASCLREWHSTNLHELLLSRSYDLAEDMSVLVNRLDIARRQLLHKILTKQEVEAVRQSVVWDLVNGNKILSGEVVVRSTSNKGRILTGDDSAIEMSKLQSAMSLLQEPPTHYVEARSLHHLLVELKSFTNHAESATLFSLSLYMRNAQGDVTLVSEAFTIEASGQQNTMAARTLFTDLNAFETDDVAHSSTRLYLAVAVITNEPARGLLPRPQARYMSTDGTYFSNELMNGTMKASGHKSGRRSLMWSQSRTSTDLQSRSKTPEYQPINSQGDAPAPKDRKYFKRLTGIGAVDITGLIKQNRPVEREIPVWSPAKENRQSSDQEPPWDSIISSLLTTSSNQYERSSTITSLSVRLTTFMNQDSEALVKATPTVLQSVQISQRLGFPGTPVRPRSDIYVTLGDPFVPFNAVLSHPKAGNVPLPNDVAMEDLQVTLEVRNAAGDRIDNCIYYSSNSTGHVAWRTTAVSRGGFWNQTIKLAIRPEDVPGSHMVMSLADAGAFPFALAWMPLWTHGAFIRDGEHSLALHRYDEVTSSIIDGKGAYLALPWTWKVTDDTVLGPGAAIRLRTYLCSTSYSQDPNLLILLRWRDQRAREVTSILRRFQFVPEIEVVKLLHDVLDALFEILVEYAGNEEIEDLVFESLVMVLGITHDRRFDLQPLVEEYVEAKFRFPFACPCLIRGFVRLLSDAVNPDSSRRLHAALKVGNHVFRFIVRARQQQSAKEAEIGIKTQAPTFAKDLQSIFTALNTLMRNPTATLIATKTLVVQNFHHWLPPLVDALAPRDFLSTASQFIDSCHDVHGRLIMYKLVMINHVVSANYFKTTDTQRIWSDRLVEWLDPYWGIPVEASQQWRDQIRMCCTIVATCVDNHQTVSSKWLQKLTESYFAIQGLVQAHTDSFSLLYPKTYPFPSKRTTSEQIYDEALIEISAVLSVITTRLLAYSDLDGIELANILSEILRIFNSVLACEAFPASWLSLYIFYHKSILQALELMAGVLVQKFLPLPEDAEAFPTDLWMSFFTTLLRVVSSDALALETFPEQKRRAVWKIAGDVREVGAELLRRNWEAMGWDASPQNDGIYTIRRMGGYQVQYVPTLVGPIVELCLSVHEGLRSAAIAVLQTMIMSEWALAEDLAILQAEIIHRLDLLFKTRNLSDSTLQKLFINELLVLFKSSYGRRNKQLLAAVEMLCDIIDHLLDLLVAVHSTEAVGEASHIIDTLRLTSFLRDMQREDIFITYVHKLAETQAAAGNPTEAGLALKMHADLYDWDTGRHVAASQEPSLPAQTSFERKERLFFEMIKYFEDGGAWELALGAYHELEHEYEFNIFDFAKLARCQRAMATIYESISKDSAHVPRYFWVSFRGLGFPVSLRDKQFIFEGLPTDRLSTFIDRMQQHYPNAHLVGRQAVEDIEGQYMTIIAVSPQKDLLHAVNRQPRVGQHVREHFMYAQPRQFATAPRRQNEKSNAQSDTIEKIVFTTAEPFPTILKRSEIIETKPVRLSPVHAALERTIRKTQELQSLENLAINGGDKHFRALIEALVILVNVDSGGSVAEYWAVVQDSMRETSDLVQIRLAEALKVALIDHVHTIGHCLSLFSRPAHLATRADLTQVFEKAFAPVLEYMRPSAARSVSVITGPSRLSNGRRSAMDERSSEPQHQRQSNGNAVQQEPETRGGEAEAVAADVLGNNSISPTTLNMQKLQRSSVTEDQIGPPAEGASTHMNLSDLATEQRFETQHTVIHEGPWTGATLPETVAQ